MRESLSWQGTETTLAATVLGTIETVADRTSRKSRTMGPASARVTVLYSDCGQS